MEGVNVACSMFSVYFLYFLKLKLLQIEVVIDCYFFLEVI